MGSSQAEPLIYAGAVHTKPWVSLLVANKAVAGARYGSACL